MKTYLIEMRGQVQTRIILADSFAEADGWWRFFRPPAQGGQSREYVRICAADVMSMETKP